MLRITTGWIAGALITAALAGPAAAQDALRVAGGEVTVVCPLTVGGSFEARTKAVSGEVAENPSQPGAMSGALKVQLDTLETGIALRDRHLRDTYLEVGKGPEYAVAVLENIRVDSTDGKGTFKGILTLHGQRSEVVGTSTVQRRGDGVKVEAQFPVRVSSFQIPEPAYLGVGVRDEIQVKVTLNATPAAAGARR
jgi:polyisoprenoid-binding protein YceI